MKTFYSVRDIEDMHAAGTTEIQIHDDVLDVIIPQVMARLQK